MPRKPLDEIIREPGSAKAAEHDRGAVGNVGNGSIDRREDLIFLTHFS
jgi:hypothetical protein